MTNSMSTRAGMRARSYHASPGEVTSVGGGEPGLWMNCANTLDDAAVPESMPERAINHSHAGTSADAVDSVSPSEDQEGIAPVPEPDSYPHVTCGGWLEVGARRASSRSRRRRRRHGSSVTIAMFRSGLHRLTKRTSYPARPVTSMLVTQLDPRYSDTGPRAARLAVR